MVFGSCLLFVSSTTSGAESNRSFNTSVAQTVSTPPQRPSPNCMSGRGALCASREPRLLGDLNFRYCVVLHTCNTPSAPRLGRSCCCSSRRQIRAGRESNSPFSTSVALLHCTWLGLATGSWALQPAQSRMTRRLMRRSQRLNGRVCACMRACGLSWVQEGRGART